MLKFCGAHKQKRHLIASLLSSTRSYAATIKYQITRAKKLSETPLSKERKEGRKEFNKEKKELAKVISQLKPKPQTTPEEQRTRNYYAKLKRQEHKLERFVNMGKEDKKLLFSRVPNPYLQFVVAKSPEVKERLQKELGRNPAAHELSKTFSTMWRELSEEEKQIYKQKFSDRRDLKLAKRNVFSFLSPASFSPYTLFVKDAFHTTDKSLTQKQRVSELARRWNEMTPEQRQKYEAMRLKLKLGNMETKIKREKELLSRTKTQNSVAPVETVEEDAARIEMGTDEEDTDHLDHEDVEEEDIDDFDDEPRSKV